MSMSCCVFSNRHLADTDAWQRSLDALSFALRFTIDDNCPIIDLSGHLPATWEGREAGFECSVEDAAEMMDACDYADLGGPWSCALEIDYHGYAGMVGAMMAAAAYAEATGGIVLECEGGVVFDAEKAIAEARKMESRVSRMIASGDA